MEKEKKTLQELVAELLAGKNIESTNVMSDLDTTTNINTDELSKRHAEDNQEEEIDTATRIKAQPFVDDINNKQEDDVDGIADGILVVTDPEISSEEFEEVADELQGIVDDTEAGEIPFTDKYEGNYILGCPICGGTFVSDTLLDSGEDACPICCKVPDNFVVNGKIENAGAVENQDDLQDSIEEIENTEEPDLEDEGNMPKTLDKNKNLLDNNKEESGNEPPLKGESKQMVGNKLQENKLEEDEDLSEVEDDIEETTENDTTNTVSKDIIASSIDVLIADEESAIDGYNSYLSQAEQTVSKELFDTLKEQIDEIIKDEQEHIEKLNTIKETLDGKDTETNIEEVEEMNESKKVEGDLSKDLYGDEAQSRTNLKLQNLDIYLENLAQALKDNDEHQISMSKSKIMSDIGYLIPALNIKGGVKGLVEYIKNIDFDFENKFSEYIGVLEDMADEYRKEYEESKKIVEENNDRHVIFSTENDYIDENNADFQEWIEDVKDLEGDVQAEAESMGVEDDPEEIENIRKGLIQSYLEEYEENDNEAIMEDWEENVKPMIENQLDTDDLLILMGTANTWNRHGNAAKLLRGMSDFSDLVSDYDAVTVVEDSNGNLSVELGHHDGTHYMNLYTSNQDTEGIYNKLIELGETEFDEYEDFDDAFSYYDMGDFIDYMMDGHQAELKEFLVPIRNQFK